MDGRRRLGGRLSAIFDPLRRGGSSPPVKRSVAFGEEVLPCPGLGDVKIDSNRRMVAQHRLALLIDAENISQKWGPEIYRRIVRTQGKPDICRLYGKAKHLQGWDKELKKACIGGYEMCLLHGDNNNADMTLAMDAIDLYRDGITFASRSPASWTGILLASPNA